AGLASSAAALAMAGRAPIRQIRRYRFIMRFPYQSKVRRRLAEAPPEIENHRNKLMRFQFYPRLNIFPAAGPAPRRALLQAADACKLGQRRQQIGDRGGLAAVAGRPERLGLDEAVEFPQNVRNLRADVPRQIA